LEGPAAKGGAGPSNVDLRLEQDLYGAILFLLKDLVRPGGPIERYPVGGEILDAERISVTVYQRHDVVRQHMSPIGPSPSTNTEA